MKLPLATLFAAIALGLAGCGEPTGPALVSAQFPAGTGLVNDASEPQSPGSLPPGAANSGGSGTFGTQDTFFSKTFGGRR